MKEKLKGISFYGYSRIQVHDLSKTGASIRSREFERLISPTHLYTSGSFVASIYFNLCALEVSSVESIIVARSCLPLAMSMLNYIFFGRQVPTTTPRK